MNNELIRLIMHYTLVQHLLGISYFVFLKTKITQGFKNIWEKHSCTDWTNVQCLVNLFYKHIYFWTAYDLIWWCSQQRFAYVMLVLFLLGQTDLKCTILFVHGMDPICNCFMAELQFVFHRKCTD